MHAPDDEADAYQAWRRAVGVDAATPGRVDIPEVGCLSCLMLFSPLATHMTDVVTSRVRSVMML